MGVKRFSYIGTDAGSGANQLVCQYRFVLAAFNGIAYLDDLQGKCLRFIKQWTGHRNTPFASYLFTIHCYLLLSKNRLLDYSEE